LAVLDEIGAADHPRFTVYNKVDLLGPNDPLPLLKSNEFVVSAVTGEGLEALVEQIMLELGRRAEAPQS
jgi:50S ribosomal subunit-associated GTPase HflX